VSAAYEIPSLPCPAFLKTDRVRLPPRPGNIRELQNVIKRGVIKTAGTVLGTKTTEHIKPESGTTTEPIKTLADAERGHITAMLREANWVVGGPHGAAVESSICRRAGCSFGCAALRSRGDLRL
jgi:hypothetical protein